MSVGKVCQGDRHHRCQWVKRVKGVVTTDVTGLKCVKGIVTTIDPDTHSVLGLSVVPRTLVRPDHSQIRTNRSTGGK